MSKIPIHINSPSTDAENIAMNGEPTDQADVQLEAKEESLEVWRDRALRLQAEIENFRKRQRRLAEQQIATEREQLLLAFARVADDLARALDVQTGVEGLRQGVKVTYQNVMHFLSQQGVEPIVAEGARFDPALHEAISTISAQGRDVEPQRVVEVTERGYRIGDRLLRPARVVVAV